MIATSAMTTFAASTVEVLYDRAKWPRAATLVAVAALGEGCSFLATLSHSRMMIILLAFVPVWALLHSSLKEDQAWLHAGGAFGTYGTTDKHPVEILVAQAEDQFNDLVDRQSKTLAEAEVEYKRRYGREPPPGFDIWFKIAKEANVTIIDDYDTVTQALEPFWGMSAKEMRARVEIAINTDDRIERISIRNHTVSAFQVAWPNYTDQLMQWIRPYLEHLPDMEIAFNGLDEPRVVIPNDMLEYYLHHCPVPNRSGNDTLPAAEVQFHDLSKQNIFEFATLSCPASSPARASPFTPSQPPPHAPPSQPLLPFITNTTLSKDICLHPTYATTNGLFSSPESLRLTTHLLPIFSQAKPSSFQDLLLPSPWYGMNDDTASYSDADDPPWEHKTPALYWSGGTTGGWARDGKWRQLHRLRFVELVNDATRPVQLLRKAAKGRWERYWATMSVLADRVHVRFTRQSSCDAADCADIKAALPFATAEEPRAAAYGSTLLADIDGHGWTERFYRLLGSRSAVLKQTVWREWHDERLVAWYHYFPISVGMEEMPELVRFLTEEEGGRAVAMRVAHRGREWRGGGGKADLRVGFFRVLLEYARLVGEERDGVEEGCGWGRGNGGIGVGVR